MSNEYPSHVLCAIDLTDVSAAAARFSATLVKSSGGRLTYVHARPPDAPLYFTPAEIPEIEERRREALSRDHAAVTAFIRRAIGEAPLDLRIAEGEPAAAILDAAADVGADLIALGTQARRGVSRLWLGSVAETVVRHSRIPVVTVPAQIHAASSGKVVSIVRNSELARPTIELSAALARTLRVELVVVNLLEPGQTGTPARELCSFPRDGCSIQYIERRAEARDTVPTAVGEDGPGLVVRPIGPDLFHTEDGASISLSLRETAAPLLFVPPSAGQTAAGG